jgi:hypothetical protein
MHRAAKFNPEWGYLAPAPTFVRTARLTAVAAVIGATAGAAVVFSLVDRPTEQSVAARTLVQQPVLSASAAAGAPVAAQRQGESRQAQSHADAAGAVQLATMPAALNAGTSSAAASESGAMTSIIQRPPPTTALVEVPAMTDVPSGRQGASESVAAATPPEAAAPQKAPYKKPRVISRAQPRYGAARYYEAQRYEMSRYRQRYVQMERDSYGWRPFGGPEY